MDSPLFTQRSLDLVKRSKKLTDASLLEFNKQVPSESWESDAGLEFITEKLQVLEARDTPEKQRKARAKKPSTIHTGVQIEEKAFYQALQHR